MRLISGPERAMITIVLTVCLGSAVWLTYLLNHPEKFAGETSSASTDTVRVVRIIDGDTIAVEPTASYPAADDARSEHIVHLLGINAPVPDTASASGQCGASASTAHLERLLDGHSKVRLTTTPARHADPYGESSAYVGVTGTEMEDLGLLQIKSGYAVAWYPDDANRPSRFARYQAAQEDAVTAAAGLRTACDAAR